MKMKTKQPIKKINGSNIAPTKVPVPKARLPIANPYNPMPMLDKGEIQSPHSRKMNESVITPNM